MRRQFILIQSLRELKSNSCFYECIKLGLQRQRDNLNRITAEIWSAFSIFVLLKYSLAESGHFWGLPLAISFTWIYLHEPDVVQIISCTIIKKKSNHDLLLATAQLHLSSCVVAYSLVYLALTGVGGGGKINSPFSVFFEVSWPIWEFSRATYQPNPVSIKSRLSLLLLRMVPVTTTVSGFFKQSTLTCAKSIGHRIH